MRTAIPSMSTRHLSVCPESVPAGAARCNVLLVGPAILPHADRRRLLKSADYCVTTVLDAREIFELRLEKPVEFAVLNDLLGPFGLRAAAESIRRQWPQAKILIVGSAKPILEDQLYDERINHKSEEDGILNALLMLGRGRQRQRAPHESDPSKG